MANQDLPQLKILVVDDMPSMRLLVTEYLRRIANIIIKEAGTEDEAIAQVKEFSPDIALMDISLGGTSGVEVTRKIKSEFPHVRVYLFSAYDADEYRDLKINSPSDGFIQKSFLKKELQQMIQKELEWKSTHQAIESKEEIKN
jgi:two-component system, NarL family, invasion response regulator UvrY